MIDEKKIKLNFYWESDDSANAAHAQVCYDQQLEEELGEDIFSKLWAAFDSPESIKANAAAHGFDAEVVEV